MIDGYTNQPLTADAAKKLQALSLEDKFLTTIEKIGQWEIATNGRWYCSFSGGKDSTVLSYIAGKYLASYREPPHPLHLLFCDTGLEYPEVRKFAMSFPDWLSKRFPTVSIDFQRRRPKKRFYDVIHDYGYPIVGKEVSQRIVEARGGNQHAIARFENQCVTKDGKYSFLDNFPKWKFLLKAPFLISDRCCKYTKKEPADTFAKKNGYYSMNATMAEESRLRYRTWMRIGCNAFDGKHPKSKPMSFWLNQDVLNYILQEEIPICSVYGEIKPCDSAMFYESTLFDTSLKCTGCQRTGCIYCGYGAHLEKGNDRRFIRLKQTHPKHWKYAIEGGEWDTDGMWKPSKTPGHVGLGIGRLLDYIGVEYK